MTTKSDDIQHEYFDLILSSQHFYLNQDNYRKITAGKLIANKLAELSDKLIEIRGLNHLNLILD